MQQFNASISDTELHVLKVLWKHGPRTVREVNDMFRSGKRRWAHTTVQTLLKRLESKGCVRSNKRGAAHVFRAVVSRSELLARRLRELADSVCDGTASPLVSALVEEQQLHSEDIDHLRRMLDELQRARQAGEGAKARKKRTGQGKPIRKDGA